MAVLAFRHVGVDMNQGVGQSERQEDLIILVCQESDLHDGQ